MFLCMLKKHQNSNSWRVANKLILLYTHVTSMCFTTTSRLICFQGNHHLRHGNEIVVLPSCKFFRRHVHHRNHVSFTLIIMAICLTFIFLKTTNMYLSMFQFWSSFSHYYSSFIPFILWFFDSTFLATLELWQHVFGFESDMELWPKCLSILHKSKQPYAHENTWIFLMRMMTMMILLLKRFTNSNFHPCHSA